MSQEDETNAETEPPKSNSRAASPMSTDQKSGSQKLCAHYQEYGSAKHAPSRIQLRLLHCHLCLLLALPDFNLLAFYSPILH